MSCTIEQRVDNVLDKIAKKVIANRTKAGKPAMGMGIRKGIMNGEIIDNSALVSKFPLELARVDSDVLSRAKALSKSLVGKVKQVENKEGTTGGSDSTIIGQIAKVSAENEFRKQITKDSTAQRQWMEEDAVFTMRITDAQEKTFKKNPLSKINKGINQIDNFGNPFAVVDSAAVRDHSVDWFTGNENNSAVEMYYNWLTDNVIPEGYDKDINKLNQRRAWILDNLARVKNSKLYYNGTADGKTAKTSHVEALLVIANNVELKQVLSIEEEFKNKANKKHVEKELLKVKLANKYIGDGATRKNGDSSTLKYKKIYQNHELANTGKYTARDVVYVSSNGAWGAHMDPTVDAKGKELVGVYKDIDLAIKAGSSIVMDSERHLKSASKTYGNAGEVQLAEYLTANGYSRESVYSKNSEGKEIGYGLWTKIAKDSGSEETIYFNSSNTNGLELLSNFAKLSDPIVIDGKKYYTVEAAFQAAKTDNDVEKERFVGKFISGADAKRLGKTVTLIADWDSKKNKIMQDLVREKFATNKIHKEMLVSTGEFTELVEDAKWDKAGYWGVDSTKWAAMSDADKANKNNMGKILEYIRSELLEGDDTPWDTDSGSDNTSETKNKYLLQGKFQASKSQKKLIDSGAEFLNKTGKTSVLGGNMMIVQGRGGTGKTSTISRILINHMKKGSKEPIIMATLSHQAKGVLQEMSKDIKKETGEDVPVGTTTSMFSWYAKSEHIEYKSPKIRQTIKLNGHEDITFTNTDAADVTRIDTNYPSDISALTKRGKGIIVIDEISMISNDEFAYLVKAAQAGVKVILMGDYHQVKPVKDAPTKGIASNNGFSNAVGLFANPNSEFAKEMKKNAVVAELTEIHRQKDGSGILDFANYYANEVDRETGISNTKMDDPVADGKDVVDGTRETAMKEIVKDVKAGTSSAYISYTNKDVVNANREIRESLYGKNIAEYKIGDEMIAYNTHTEDNQPMITNSQKLTITKISDSSDTENITFTRGRNKIQSGYKPGTQLVRLVVQDFVDKDVSYSILVPKGLLSKVEQAYSNSASGSFNEMYYSELKKHLVNGNKLLAHEVQEFGAGAAVNYGHAITIHKSQGATYAKTYVNLSGNIDSNLAYTAVTRASEKMMIVDKAGNQMSGGQTNIEFESPVETDTNSEPQVKSKTQDDKFVVGNITELDSNEVFVFGANGSGIHGAGAAKTARTKGWIGKAKGNYGNKYGQVKNGYSEGDNGKSYGIVTKVMKGKKLVTITKDQLKKNIEKFVKATQGPKAKDNTFMVTAIGTGLATFNPTDVMQMFVDAGAMELDNIKFPAEWKNSTSGSESTKKNSKIVNEAVRQAKQVEEIGNEKIAGEKNRYNALLNGILRKITKSVKPGQDMVVKMSKEESIWRLFDSKSGYGSWYEGIASIVDVDAVNEFVTLTDKEMEAEFNRIKIELTNKSGGKDWEKKQRKHRRTIKFPAPNELHGILADKQDRIETIVKKSTVAHEITHGIVSDFMEAIDRKIDGFTDPDGLNETIEKLFAASIKYANSVDKNTNPLWTKTLKATKDGKSIPYWMHNKHEFVSEAISNPAIMAELNNANAGLSTELKGKGIIQGLWHAIIAIIEQVTGEKLKSRNVSKELLNTVANISTAVAAMKRRPTEAFTPASKAQLESGSEVKLDLAGIIC